MYAVTHHDIPPSTIPLQNSTYSFLETNDLGDGNSSYSVLQPQEQTNNVSDHDSNLLFIADCAYFNYSIKCMTQPSKISLP